MMDAIKLRMAPSLRATSSDASLAGAAGWRPKPLASATASIRPPPQFVPSTAATLEEEIYQVLADAKISVSRVASHLPDDQRRRLFSQIDRLHDVDDWESGDMPAQRSSFQTFLRTILTLLRATSSLNWPSLGMSHRGHLLASWGTQEDHLTLEFLAGDRVQWSLSCPDGDDQAASVVGEGAILSLIKHLSPYDPEHWFGARRIHSGQ